MREVWKEKVRERKKGVGEKSKNVTLFGNLKSMRETKTESTSEPQKAIELD